MRIIASTLTIGLMVGSAALAKPPLREVSEIDDGLMIVAIADAIRKTCDDINPRLIRAYSALTALKETARDKGYTEKEVERYVTSKAEKDRMRAKAERFLQDKGVQADDDAALCRFGREQIQSQTDIGQLLR
ncbi:DUF5333 domain-containing protein [Marivita sp. S0852]|uniref:DUF5333 domain-containing protein n=1 Tax=Marivita sp. S0852 TaxID=3373893 RepID=UPI003981E61D